jgi:hypothetical protein
VVPDRPFVPRSGFPIASQEATLELTHIIAAVQLPGYDEGQVVGRGQDQSRGTIETAETDIRCLPPKVDISTNRNREERDDAVLQKLGQEGTL